jgi:hypothetical protein
VGVREALGERALSVACRNGGKLPGDAVGRVGTTAKRTRYGGSAATQELAASHSGGVEHFRRDMCEIYSH